MSRRLLTLSALVLLPLAACGDDEAATDRTGATPTTTARSGTGGEETSGAGELTVGGTTYAFEATTCDLEEQAGDGPTIDIEVHGEGEAGGEPFRVDVLRRTTSRGATTETVRLDLTTTPGEDRVSVFTGVYSADSGDPTLESDEEVVTATPTFTAVGEAPEGEGRLLVTCG